MKCERIREKLLTEYIDGRATETLKMEIEKHLEDCNDCKEYYQTLKEKVGSDKGKLIPTDIGMIVTDFLVNHFEHILDYNFTAKVEEEFDDIA